MKLKMDVVNRPENSKSVAVIGHVYVIKSSMCNLLCQINVKVCWVRLVKCRYHALVKHSTYVRKLGNKTFIVSFCDFLFVNNIFNFTVQIHIQVSLKSDVFDISPGFNFSNALCSSFVSDCNFNSSFIYSLYSR